MDKILREPFFHFVLIAAALFVLYAVVGQNDQRDVDTIVVTQGKVENLRSVFEKTWQRQPTDKEMQGLIDDYLREEVFYREAVRVGLDQNDIIIRRRMRQKMEFIAEDLAETIEPTDDELAEYLKSREDYFAVPPLYTFRQVYINAEKYPDLQAEAELRKQQILSQPDPATISLLSDPLMLEYNFNALSPDDISKAFGVRFAAALVELPVAEWSGPVESGFGYHLVYVDKVQPGRNPEMSEVREYVLREWQHEKRQETLEKFYNGLKSQYEVIIEGDVENATNLNVN